MRLLWNSLIPIIMLWRIIMGSSLGRLEEARQQYEQALAVELRHGATHDDSGLCMARYFLEEHLLRMRLPEQAIAAVTPGLNQATEITALLQVVESEGLWSLGHAQEAAVSASRALELAHSDERRERIREKLRHILNAADV